MVFRRLAVVTIATIVGTNVMLCATGYFVFNRAALSPLHDVDAIVVLAGEHDGREEYGISLAQQGLASVVVLSNPYRSDDNVMRRLCDAHYDRIEVICHRPHATNTKAEARMARELATARHWRKLMVVTWRFHIPRARLIFSQCFTSATAVSYAAVPRQYLYSLAAWNSQYIYQYAALLKAVIASSCD